MATPPTHFSGKISLEPMSFPVNLGCHDTHNYDLDNITHWVDTGGESSTGKLDCPTCRKDIQPDQISYNTALAKEIHDLAIAQPGIFEASTLSAIMRDTTLPEGQINEKVQGLKSLISRKFETRETFQRSMESLEARVSALFARALNIGREPRGEDEAPVMRISIFGSRRSSDASAGSDNTLVPSNERRGAIIQIGGDTIVLGYTP
ncbi:MAG: hypothetical protein ACI9S8_002152 [Chlamydiales bacterium]|jgi:hypothetical protein